jgi:hypothetical protein
MVLAPEFLDPVNQYWTRGAEDYGRLIAAGHVGFADRCVLRLSENQVFEVG